MSQASFPISIADARQARDRIAPYLQRTPLRSYAELDAAIGHGIRVLVKHENHLPTNSFKVRNGLSAVTALAADERSRGVVCGSRGNHGQGVAFAGSRIGVPVTVVVPHVAHIGRLEQVLVIAVLTARGRLRPEDRPAGHRIDVQVSRVA